MNQEKKMDNYTQEPRPLSRFSIDVSEAAHSANIAALEHSGKDNERYVQFLRGVIDELRYYADDTEAEIIRIANRKSNEARQKG